MFVLKIGGNELDQPAFVEGLAATLRGLSGFVVVHGGGTASTALAARLGLQTRFVDGLRVTDDATLEVAVMGMVGLASTQLVGGLVRGGVPALGLSGVDAGLVTVRATARVELGHVGEPTAVDVERLRALCAAGFVPCVAPICADRHGRLFNVNADSVAAAMAGALHAEALLFVTATPGVKSAAGEVLARLTPSACESLITDGVVTDGMIPKVRAACDALSHGVARAVIVDLAGLRARLHDADHKPGTEVVLA